jgi:hypothetical protein
MPCLGAARRLFLRMSAAGWTMTGNTAEKPLAH